MFNKFAIITLFPLILSLMSCEGNKKNNTQNMLTSVDEQEKMLKKFIDTHCIRDDFKQGEAANVYGLDCIEGKSLVIKTSNEGEWFSTSKVSDSKIGLKIADDVSFKNKFYIPNSYTILKGKGHDKKLPFLLDLLPKDEEIRGSLNTEYRIIFQTMGDYLVLFKAAKDLKDLPYVERTSLKIFRDEKMMDYNKNSYEREKGDYYMVPFIGYVIKYCKAESVLAENDKRTRKSLLSCTDSYIQSKSYPYIQLNMDSKRLYDYKLDLKKDFFPSEYFNGLWYFMEGPVEKATSKEKLNHNKVYLVSFEREGNNFNLKDMSGNVDYADRESRGIRPVKWLDFEMAQDGNGYWDEFGERKEKHSDEIDRSYVQFDFNYYNEETKNAELLELIIEKDYLSYIHKITDDDGNLIKNKTSFFKAQDPHEDCSANNNTETNTVMTCLKEKISDREGFVPRKWFPEDNKNVFGFLSIAPQNKLKLTSVTTEDRTKHIRIIKFNTSLKEEKGTKIIKWYFSKNSTKEPEYRKAAQQAVEIYNQAFAYLSKGRDKKIEVKLVQGEEKDLGDIRYNIINLIKAKDLQQKRSAVLGSASSYAYPDTGQIIGAAVNIIIHNKERIFYNYVRDYIRYEIFQRRKRTKEENEIHVVTPYIREQIQEKCPEVTHFVKEKTSQQPEYSNEWSGKNHRERQEILIAKGQGRLKQNEELGDKDIIIPCRKKLTANSLLPSILRAMGHNFGLANNFKASTDKENYWTMAELESVFPGLQIDSEKELAKSSSVMDVFNMNQPAMDYLGKYDLAALRYLYFYEIEMQDGTIENIAEKYKDISDPPESIANQLKKQQALTEDILTNRKPYQYCSNKDLDSMMCEAGDYGSSPQEIVQELILSYKRDFNQFKYRYDMDEWDFTFVSIQSHTLLYKTLKKIKKYYDKWLDLRKSYFDNQGFRSDYYYALTADSTAKYKAGIDQGKEGNKEYALYYPVREEISNFIMTYLLDLDEMKCHIENEESTLNHIFSLEIIKSYLKEGEYSENLYVEDCHSLQILDFFKNNNLTLVKQTGHENFKSYYSNTNKHSNSTTAPKAKFDVWSIERYLNFKKPNDPQSQPILNPIRELVSSMITEPDKLHDFGLEIKKKQLENQIVLGYAQYFIKESLLKQLEKIKTEYPNQTTIQDYKNDFRMESFLEAMFYQQVGQYLPKENDNPAVIHQALSGFSPFIQTTYKAYNEKRLKDLASQHTTSTTVNNIPSFWSFLLERKDTMIVYKSQYKTLNVPYKTLNVPYKEDSFYAKINRQYNQAKEDLEKLQKKDPESLSTAQKLEIIKIKRLNQL